MMRILDLLTVISHLEKLGRGYNLFDVIYLFLKISRDLSTTINPITWTLQEEDDEQEPDGIFKYSEPRIGKKLRTKLVEHLIANDIIHQDSDIHK